jgi:hypothetical protein
MKHFLLLALALAGGSLPAEATTIALSDFSGTILSNPVTYWSGARMADGSGLIRIGYFNTSAQSASWPTDLQSNNLEKVRSALQSFIPLGENAATPNLGNINADSPPRFTTRAIGGILQPGRLAGSITGVNPVIATPNSINAAGVPAGSRIFMLVYSDNDPGFLNHKYFGVFSADFWLMPDDPSLPLQLNTTDVDTPAEIFRGVAGNHTLQITPTNPPEPSTGMMLLACGFLAFLRRRRKTAEKASPLCFLSGFCRGGAGHGGVQVRTR